MFGNFARQRQKRERLFKGDFVCRDVFRQRGLFGILFLAQLHIRAKAAVAHGDFEIGCRIAAQNFHARTPRRITLCIGRDGARELAFGIIGAADKGAELRQFQRKLTRSAGRAGTRIIDAFFFWEDMWRQKVIQRIEHLRGAQISCASERYRKLGPEVSQQLLPVNVVAGDEIELFFERGCEIIFHIAGEEAFQKRDNQAAAVFRHEAFFIEAYIFAVAQNGERGGISRGAADAELFHALHKSCFGKARRRLSEMLHGFDALFGQSFALRHGRQTIGIFIIIVVAAFLIEFQEAIETHDLSRRTQINLLVSAAIHAGCNINAGALKLGRFHLARNGARPDEIIEFGLFDIFSAAVEFARQAAEVGRAHGFMRFLRIFRLGRIFARDAWQIFAAKFLLDHTTRAGNGFGRHIDTVGPHISDDAVFIETLCNLHGARWCETKLARSFLL